MRSLKYDFALSVDANSSLGLQHQVRQRLIDGISRGILRPGRRLPSSRRLAEQAGVSRNTITLAYDALLAEGHLQSRPRSGVYVAADVPIERITTGRRGLQKFSRDSDNAAEPVADTEFRVPPNWRQYPFPFIDGCIEPDLLPVEGWREALRLSCSKRDLLRWGAAADGADDPRFLDELRTKLLPSWGINAAPDEVLATLSVHQALYLVLETLLDRNPSVVVDSALDPLVRRFLRSRNVTPLPLEWQGATASLSAPLPRDTVVLVGSRRAAPSSIQTRERAEALLRAAAASNATIVEAMHSFELPEAGRNTVALRALNRTGRVVSIGALAAVTALGTAPGIIHGNARTIARIRSQRRYTGGEFPAGLQCAWAYFIGLGHYARALTRARVQLVARRTALRDALNHYLHRFVSIATRPTSSAYWISGGPQWNAENLARAAAEVGVLIEPVAEAGETAQLCMGVTSIRTAQVREGVATLARIIRADPQLGSRKLRDETLPMLTGLALRRVLSGTTLLYNTVYGEPCTLHLGADGSLSGRAGYSKEDRDNGRWWVESDRWFRQWHQWAYGEAAGYFIVVQNEQMRIFNNDGLLVDTAVIVRRERKRRAG
jgi:GntR family transcriptional regulator/MocR family aminotransferase